MKNKKTAFIPERWVTDGTPKKKTNPTATTIEFDFLWVNWNAVRRAPHSIHEHWMPKYLPGKRIEMV